MPEKKETSSQYPAKRGLYPDQHGPPCGIESISPRPYGTTVEHYSEYRRDSAARLVVPIGCGTFT